MLKAASERPGFLETRRLLAYAYLECEQYDESLRRSIKLREDEPKWIYLKGEPEHQPNAVNRARGRTRLRATLRAYGDELQVASDRLSPDRRRRAV